MGEEVISIIITVRRSRAELRVFLNAATLLLKDLKNYGHEMANEFPLFGMTKELVGLCRWGYADLASTLRNQMHMMLAPATTKITYHFPICNAMNWPSKKTMYCLMIGTALSSWCSVSCHCSHQRYFFFHIHECLSLLACISINFMEQLFVLTTFGWQGTRKRGSYYKI